jgi:UDP-galactopyranose mutase
MEARLSNIHLRRVGDGGRRRVLVVGAGMAGAVLARGLAESGEFDVKVIDVRDHVAGNCHTARDAETGVMVHVHGPHIFNTNHDDVWAYVQRFGEWMPHVNRVKAVTTRGVFPFPINLHTLNQFFGRTMNQEEARACLEDVRDRTLTTPQNFEEQALSQIGRDLYETFLRDYTRKQWGVDPDQLPASLLRRLPVRFDENDSYYSTRHQAMPRHGYTAIVEAILDHPRIELCLGERFDRAAIPEFDRVFYSGAIDAYFGHRHGRLGYRTVTFQRTVGDGDLQGNGVLNYPGAEVPWTRRHEHKYFAPWESHERSVLFTEFSQETGPNDLPYYPKHLAGDKRILERYLRDAEAEQHLTFLGRLGTYRYLDMDQVIGESLDLVVAYRLALAEGLPSPVFGPKRAKERCARDVPP